MITARLVETLRRSPAAATLTKLHCDWSDAISGAVAQRVAEVCRSAVVVDYYGEDHTLPPAATKQTAATSAAAAGSEEAGGDSSAASMPI